MTFFTFFTQTLQGKTIYRILFNDLVATRCRDLDGKVLDLAGGITPSYEALLPKGIRVTRSDVKGALPVDFNRPLPYNDSAFDAVLLFNALYIAEDPVLTLREIRRVLVRDGVLYLSSPFIANEMPEPHDYRRLTAEGLELVLVEAGFKDVRLERIGERFTSAAYLLHPLFFFSIIRLIVNGASLGLDALIPYRLRRAYPVPLGYFVTAR